MRIEIKLGVVAAIIALGLAWTAAAAPSYVTNEVQNVTLALTATVQGQIVTNYSATVTNVYTNMNSFSIATRDFISDMGALQGTNYTARALLLRLSPPTGNPYFVIRDVVNNTNVDFPVSSNNIQNGPFAVVTQSTTVNGKTVGSIFSNEYFFLSTYSFGAALEGYATTAEGSQVMTATVLGSGAFTNAIALFRGNILFSAQRAETDLAASGQPLAERPRAIQKLESDSRP